MPSNADFASLFSQYCDPQWPLPTEDGTLTIREVTGRPGKTITGIRDQPTAVIKMGYGRQPNILIEDYARFPDFLVFNEELDEGRYRIVQAPTAAELDQYMETLHVYIRRSLSAMMDLYTSAGSTGSTGGR